jgi:hypothetical protein
MVFIRISISFECHLNRKINSQKVILLFPSIFRAPEGFPSQKHDLNRLGVLIDGYNRIGLQNSLPQRHRNPGDREEDEGDGDLDDFFWKLARDMIN